MPLACSIVPRVCAAARICTPASSAARLPTYAVTSAAQPQSSTTAPVAGSRRTSPVATTVRSLPLAETIRCGRENGVPPVVAASNTCVARARSSGCLCASARAVVGTTSPGANPWSANMRGDHHHSSRTTS